MKRKYDKLLSNLAYNFNVRRYSMFITFESARITNPGACTAVITDTATPVDMTKPGMDQVMVHRFQGLVGRCMSPQ